MKKKSDKNNPTKKDEILSKIEEEFKRHTHVLMEKMESTVKTVTEQHSSAVKKLDELKNDVDGLKYDSAIIKPAVEKHSKDINEVKSEINTMQSVIKELDVKTDRIEHKLDTVTTDHEGRLRKLETVN